MARRSQATPPHPDLFDHGPVLPPQADAADLGLPTCTCGAGQAMRAGEGAPTAAKALGPITEHRFVEAFKDRALASAKVAAKLVGLDVETLSAMADAGIIRAVRKGRLRSYTEHALRAYLLDGPDAPSRAPSDRRPSEKRRVHAPPFSKRRTAHR